MAQGWYLISGKKISYGHSEENQSSVGDSLVVSWIDCKLQKPWPSFEKLFYAFWPHSKGLPEIKRKNKLRFELIWIRALVLAVIVFHLNRLSRRKRGMAYNPLFIIPDFILHFPNELCYGYLRFEGNGKTIAKFIGKMQKKSGIMNNGFDAMPFSS